MSRISQSIKNRMSLRPPQALSLDILAKLSEDLKLVSPPLNNGAVDEVFIQEQLNMVSGSYPTCTDFERQFPSLTFALATGVGKTRLMGAFITYLYLKKGIRNYFVVAPNLTIYEKLAREFGDIKDPKYVFKGIGEFVHNQPIIITGDNYNKHRQDPLFEEIRINIFNISKINAETKGGKLPRIKRLSEYLGDSYFNYLSSLDDLVLLMDESHHYRADRGMQVINELNPVLGLELTATPQVQNGTTTIPFKNCVYEYSLAKAIRDGFVKQPAVATRKDFDPSQFSLEEMDRIKLEDGIKIHEDTKVALDIYSQNSKKPKCKPFVLVVARDTVHAQRLEELIRSSSFFNGNYSDKVITVHSNIHGEEKEETIQKLLSVEDSSNKVEIVIHVYMLKEGWDVTNLYTIVPLNAAGSKTLIEQTIGRGLRLPYGTITGDKKVDTLTIVAHDKFQDIIEEANKPGSLIHVENIIDINSILDLKPKEIVVSESEIGEATTNIIANIIPIADPTKEVEIRQAYQAVTTSLVGELTSMNSYVKNIDDLKKDEIREIVIANVTRKMQDEAQQNLFTEEIVSNIRKAYDDVVDEYIDKTIEIPRIVIQHSSLITWGFNDFDLDTSSLNLQPNDQQIMIVNLTNGQIEIRDANDRKYSPDSLENLIVSELMNFSDIDYDTHAELLFKLAHQAIEKLSSYLDKNGLCNVILYQKREIARFIYAQMMNHYFENKPTFEKPKILPFDTIRKHNYEKFAQDSIALYTQTIEPTSAVPTMVFHGFSKACHKYYKFDSKTEKDFAIILENDTDVVKWMRPAFGQFRLYWNHNSKEYIPDFVVETKDSIYLVETKDRRELESGDVLQKQMPPKSIADTLVLIHLKMVVIRGNIY
jgi:type III restriction enzyme